MHRLIEFGILFFAVVLLQTFLFGNVNLGIYIHPMIYLAFILLLPVELPSVIVLLLGLLTGVTVDFFCGTAGLTTVSILPVALVRRRMIELIAGRDEIKEGGIPGSRTMGPGKFLRYISLSTLFYCSIYFMFEIFSFGYFGHTLLRIILSSICTIPLIYICRLMMKGKQKEKSAI